MQFYSRKSEGVTNLKRRSDSDLKTALFQVLCGIEREWQMDQNDLAKILHRSPSTISEWKNKGAVTVSPENPSPNDTQIYEFIEFYDAVNSLFLRIEDQITWLKRPSQDFGGASPFELLKTHTKNLYALREWIDHVGRS